VRACVRQEVLVPQPRAAAVMAELLQWIDRADMAAQAGAPRPPFVRDDGSPIFPDEPWWLTEVERRAQGGEEQEEEVAPDAGADDDGPASAREEVSDDDPLSSGEDVPFGLGRTPSLAWTGTRRFNMTAANAATYPRPTEEETPESTRSSGDVPVCFFERQQEAYCAVHALNNALGLTFCTPEDMEAACDEVLRAAAFEGTIFCCCRCVSSLSLILALLANLAE
jgi:hypothetical protein